jgi:hypothetical protein
VNFFLKENYKYAMTGYLNFLRSLTDLQQRHAIGQLIRSRSIKPIAEEMLNHPTVVEFNESLGWRPYWKPIKDKFDPDVVEIGPADLTADLCIAPITIQYRNLNHKINATDSNLDYELTVNALLYIDDEGEPMIGTVTCIGNQDVVDAEKEAFDEVKKTGYLNYLRALTPDKQRDAIWDLSVVVWGTDDAEFLKYGELGTALMQQGVELLYSEHEVGPVQLYDDYGTASMSYTLYGYPPEEQDEISEAERCIGVNILACIKEVCQSDSSDARPQLLIKELCFSIIPAEDHEQRELMIVH